MNVSVVARLSPITHRRCLAAVRMAVVVGMLTCASGLPAGLLQVVAWFQMAEGIGGLSKLEQVMVSEPACELCKLSRKLADDSPEERRGERERAPLKPDPAAFSGWSSGDRACHSRVEDPAGNWSPWGDENAPRGWASRPPTPPPRDVPGQRQAAA